MSRAKWKGPYVEVLEEKDFQKHKQKAFILSRSSEIVPAFLGLTFNIYNGKIYVELTVTDEMIGHKFGEFSFTRSKFMFRKKNKQK
jgi:small subunit ribosomal protein S19